MKESEIRPSDIFEEYLRLSEKDIEHCFTDDKRLAIKCPACGLEQYRFSFEKHGFSYQDCTNCGSLFMSPRPTIESFERFYNDSKSSRYWAETFFPAVAELRREKIFKPRAERVKQLCTDNGIIPENLMDIGAGYGIFIEEWTKISPITRSIAVEPSIFLAEVCKEKGIEVIESIAEKITGYREKINLLTCFEVLEHVYDPFSFVKILSNLIQPGGAMLITTLCVDGFDIQLLWEQSNSISPPHHINFLSVKGLECLFKRAGMDTVKVFTPGVLDVDIIKNVYREKPEILDGNRFLKKIVQNDELGQNFQEFLSNNKLSSHAWVFALKS